MMASNPSIRASDQDRDRAARLLSEHHAAGRLDAGEFAERLDRVYTAKTIADLDELTADLPAIDLYPLPSASLPKNRRFSSELPAASVVSRADGRLRRLPPGWAIASGTWSLVMLVCLTLWAVSGNPWPLLLAGAAGVVVAGQWAARRALGSGGSRRQIDRVPPGSVDEGNGDT